MVALSTAEAEYYSLVTGVQRTMAIQGMLTEIGIKTKLIVRTDSLAAKQPVEKVGLLHVKHMSMRMMFLKDLQRSGCIEVEKILGISSPADMFTKPLNPREFAKCRARIPGIFWGDDAHEIEVHMFQFQENQEVNGFDMVQLVGAVIEFLRWLGECAKLILSLVGMLSLVRHFGCPQRGKATRTIGTQSQCTYTSLLHVHEPRFQLLDAKGAFL